MKNMNRSVSVRPSRTAVSGLFGCFLMLAATGCTMEQGGDTEVGTLEQDITGGWTTLTPINGWQAYPGAATPAIGMVDGVVRLRGAIRGPNATSNIAFMIPPNFQSPDCLQLRATMGTSSSDSSGGRLLYGCNLFGGQGAGTFHMHVNQDGYLGTNSGPDAKAFTSLDGLSYDKDVYSATAILLENGWAATYSYRMGGTGSHGGEAVYAKLVDGYVRLQGHVSAGTNTRMFRLPTNLRPSSTLYVPVTLCNSYGRLVVYSSGNVYVQPESGSLSDATCGVSLEGSSFPLAALPTAMTPDNSWQTYWRAPKLRSSGGGVVHFEGNIQMGTSTTIDTLPSNVRPPSTVRVVADTNGAREARLVIDTAGVVKVTGVPLSVSSGFTSLDGASFAF